MSSLNEIKAGFVQFDVVYGDLDKNFEKVRQGIEELGLKKVEIAVLPEMWSCGFDYIALEEHAEKTPDLLKKLSELAIEKNMVIAGSLPEMEEGKIYNTLYVIEKDGKVKGSYRKIHLFSHSGEHRKFERGGRAVVLDTSVGRLGLLICYDLRFPELGRALADMGADIFIVCAQWPSPRQVHWETLVKARAIENQLFVIACNRVGSDELEYRGGSMIVSPKGKVLAGAEDDFSVCHCGIDFMEIIEYRSQIPSLNERIPSAYKVS